MKKMNLKKQGILFMAAALMFTGMPMGAAADEVNGSSVGETATEAEKKAPIQVIYEPGGYAEFPCSLFEKGEGPLVIEAEGIGTIEEYYSTPDTIRMNIPYDRDVKKGVYPLKFTFEYTSLGNNVVDDKDVIYDDVVELVVEEDMQGFHLLNTVVDYDGSKDAVFRFKNGTGKNRVVEIQEAGFWGTPELPDSVADEHTAGFSLMEGEFIRPYWTYNLDKGEFIIKKEFFETRVNDFGWIIDPWVYRGIIESVKFANGNVVEMYNTRPESVTLTKDFVNPGDAKWYLLYNVDESSNPVEPEEPQPTDPVEDFVKRLYTNILQREADPSGLKAWTDVLKSGKEQGAKVAQGFIESPEFQKRKLSDTQYLEILYQTFFDRKADQAGLNAWLSVLDSGLSRMHVFKGFAESNEFTEICEEYDIIRGNVTLTAPMDQNEGVTKFIARCYRLCLGRKADKDGLNSWCTQILTGKNTAKEAAHGFVFSDEFKKKNLSDKEYVKTMYRVFMDREADPAGLDAWVKVLKSGKSREHVFNGFADSGEFKEICAEYGIR